ncbi:hypothetical protein SO802_028158 [Lithocarpus litseifolius]|uniref:Uncharacterized protein n=1 Tax=Lithocarpus litseifolius TaxID=425828 RepID=A0AAW2BT17_9ROSI
MLMNLMSLSLPMETTCGSVDSLALKPTKQPTLVTDSSMFVYGEDIYQQYCWQCGLTALPLLENEILALAGLSHYNRNGFTVRKTRKALYWIDNIYCISSIVTWEKHHPSYVDIIRSAAHFNDIIVEEEKLMIQAQSLWEEEFGRMKSDTQVTEEVCFEGASVNFPGVTFDPIPNSHASSFY